MKKHIVLKRIFIFFVMICYQSLIHIHSQNAILKHLYLSDSLGSWYDRISTQGEKHIVMRSLMSDSVWSELKNQRIRYVHDLNIDCKDEAIKDLKDKPNEEWQYMYIDDVITFEDYSLDDKIQILKEFLSFHGDTIHSSKSYIFKPGSGFWPAKNKACCFSVQIEALFSFTRMITRGYRFLFFFQN